MNWKHVSALPGSLLLFVVVGCTTSPSVTPLLRLSHDAVTAEAARLREDVAQQRAGFDQTRNALADAYEADLRNRTALDADWVLEATTVYVAACEALLEHEAAQRQAREQRADNLDAAAEATERAAALLEQRDQLLNDTVAARLWRVLGGDESGATR